MPRPMPPDRDVPGGGLMLSIDVPRGSFRLRLDARLDHPATAVFGPSGAGKTTLLHALSGFLPRASGTIALRGRALLDTGSRISVPPEHRRIAVAFQDALLFPHRTAEQNLRFGRRREGPESMAFDEVVEPLGLGPLLGRRPAELSGGQQRLVTVGRALLSGPELLLLDEPFAGLDEQLRRQLVQLLQTASRDRGVQLVLVSHSLLDILELTTEVLVLSGGELVAQGPVHEVLQQRRVFELAERLGLDNLLEMEVLAEDGDRDSWWGRLGDQRVYLPPHPGLRPGTGLLALRPEDVILSRRPVTGISAQNCLAGRVHSVTEAGSRCLVQIDIGQRLSVEVTPRAVEELEIRPGADLFCLIKTLSFRWRRAP